MKKEDEEKCVQPRLYKYIIIYSVFFTMNMLNSKMQGALGEGGVGGGSVWGTHVNPWLIHVNLWQKKPLQYYKVISLQLIKIIGKKIK